MPGFSFSSTSSPPSGFSVTKSSFASGCIVGKVEGDAAVVPFGNAHGGQRAGVVDGSEGGPAPRLQFLFHLS